MYTPVENKQIQNRHKKCLLARKNKVQVEITSRSKGEKQGRKIRVENMSRRRNVTL